jgi:hypothetical protein
VSRPLSEAQAARLAVLMRDWAVWVEGPWKHTGTISSMLLTAEWLEDPLKEWPFPAMRLAEAQSELPLA